VCGVPGAGAWHSGGEEYYTAVVCRGFLVCILRCRYVCGVPGAGTRRSGVVGMCVVSSYVYFVVGMCVVSQVQALGAAALGNIIKSLARAQYNDDTLFRSLAAAVVRLPSSAFDAQVC